MRNTTLLCGYVGSRAYGMETPDSDWDQFGVYIEPTENFLGLPARKPETYRSAECDHTEHEIRHFLELALVGNPAIIELLFLEEYNVMTGPGEELVGMRNCFLAAPNVRERYIGYATEQLNRMLRQPPAQDTETVRKRSKNARHLLRLLDQGLQLLRTGELVLKVQDPHRYFAFGARAAADPQLAAAEIEAAREEYDKAHSPLPQEPDRARVEQWLRNLRLAALRGVLPEVKHFPWPQNG